MHWSCDTGGYRGGAFRAPYVPGPGNIEQIVNPDEHEQLKATWNDASGHYVNDAGERVVFQLRWGGSAHPHIFYYFPYVGGNWYDIEGPVINHTGSLEDYWFGGRYGFIHGIDRLLARPRSLVEGTITSRDTIDLAPRFVRNIGFFDAFRPVADAAPSNLFLAGGEMRPSDPVGAIVGVLSAEGIPEPEFELVGEHERVELDQRTRRQLMLKQPIPQDIDAAVTEEITVKAINRAGESEPVTFTLTIHPDE